MLLENQDLLVSFLLRFILKSSDYKNIGLATRLIENIDKIYFFLVEQILDVEQINKDSQLMHVIFVSLLITKEFLIPFNTFEFVIKCSFLISS